uniref:cytochrome P450 n=1 Tax=Streptomyces longispororuber TaxID=68230 RepID=UPI0021095991|nr:cytochrome P450 [Streptomyces longispororuber]
MRAGQAPGAWPVVGHLPDLLRRPLAFMDSLPAHGDIVRVRIGLRDAYVLCHPELVRRVLTDSRVFDREGPLYEKVRAALGNGLASCPRADHRGQRRVLQPAFHHKRLERYAQVMSVEVETLTDRWRSGQVVDAVDEMFRLTTAVAVRTLFSSDFPAPVAEELRDCLDVFLRGVYTRVLMPAVDAVPSPGRRRYRRALVRWRALVSGIIAEYRAAGVDQDDVLSLLLAARDDSGRPLSDHELCDQVALLVLAGAETTSSALAWCVQLLGSHSDVLDRLQTEADTVLGGSIATWDDLPDLTFTHRVVQEVLRLYPPAWAITRTTVEPVELAGEQLALGSMVICSPYVIHRRDDFFPDAAAFDPDRWQNGHPHREAYLPFGLGANKCIGEAFGLAEATLALASLVSRWHLRPLPTRSSKAAPRSVLAPGSLPVLVDARLPTPRP